MVGAANRCKAGMASADPMRVWGRLKRHTTMGKGTFSFILLSSATTSAEATLDNGATVVLRLLVRPAVAMLLLLLPSRGSLLVAFLAEERLCTLFDFLAGSASGEPKLKGLLGDGAKADICFAENEKRSAHIMHVCGAIESLILCCRAFTSLDQLDSMRQGRSSFATTPRHSSQ